MKLLLDENLPKKLKQDFIEFEIYTVVEMGWSGTTNGVLMQLMISQQFDVLLTFDKNLQYQQNFSKYTIAVVVLNAPNNTHATLKHLVAMVKEYLASPMIKGPKEIKIQ
ncbi:MAG: DUF5615 family PIN-like protein [Flavobacteriales bacterium]|jgi:predicted nuclease of predicted toxin-antitoxin system